MARTQEAARLRAARPRRPRFRDAPIRNLWRYAADAMFFFILAALFVYVLNTFSARTGAIIKVNAPASSKLFTGEKRDGLNVMRLPLGQPVSYDLDWHYLENCQTTVALEFDQTAGPKPWSRIILELDGKHYPVGSPGLDHFDRPQPMGLHEGLWKYSATVGALCANGRRPLPQVTSQFFIDVYNPRQPALVLEDPVQFMTPMVRKGERLHWREDLRRNIVGRTTAIFTFISKNIGQNGPGISDVITVQRPGLNTMKTVGVLKNLDFYQDLPSEIHPGPWQLQASALTDLPDGRVQNDILFTVNFEVLP